MKKILDTKFLIIVALSAVVLMILGVLAFYLFDNSDATFIKSGYVLNPLSAKSEKFYFDENTKYHENLSRMVVFDDVDKKEVSVYRDSFVHYLDNSLSFLTDGAILDLDSIKGTDAVKFYNISNRSLIEKRNDEYVIENIGADINFKNFMGRISEDKYIVAGLLEAKIPGNETNIKGDYFEIVYVDEGVINIENKDVKFTVAAEGSYIYVGDIVIDLGNKKIIKNDEDVMSITAITINGNENIEIIPKAPEEEEDNNGGAGNTANQDNNNNQDNNQQGGQDAGGEAGGEAGNGNQTGVVEVEPLLVALSEAEIDSTSVTVTFDIDNYLEDDMLTLKVTNLDTGRTVNMFEDIHSGDEIRVNLLSPDTKYLFTVVNEKDESKYFQKVFETNDFGITFEKSYVTDSEIGYRVIIDEGSEIADARLTLKKFNEETNENEVVGSYQLRDLMSMTPGVHDGIIFPGLDSDTIYTAVLDNFSFASIMFNDIYNVSLTSLTLKKAPTFGNMVKEVNNDNFKIYIDEVIDKDNAITSYTYFIYENDNTETTAIDPISKTNASAVTVYIGDGPNELLNDVNYYYKVAIEYFDNEKYVEYIMDGQINLFKGSDPYITISKNDDYITHNQIGFTIYLMDNSCLISMPGRDKCDDISSVQIDVKKKNYGFGGTETSIAGYPIPAVEFDVEGKNVKKDFIVSGLEPGVTYVIYVSAIRNDKPEQGIQPIYEPDGPTMIATKTLTSYNADWQNGSSTTINPIEATLSLTAIESANSLSGSDTAELVKKVIFRLYDGEYTGTLQNQKLVTSKTFTDTDDFNIKEMIFDNPYTVTTLETFGITFDQLVELTGNANGKLSEYYTLYVEAYYDMAETNPVNINGKQHSYYINKVLRADDIHEPIVDVLPIKKRKDDGFDNNLTTGTVVGYTVTASIDRDGFISNDLTPNYINYYVYNDKRQKVNFLIKRDDEFVSVDKYTVALYEAGSSEIEIYMDYGTEYGVVDTMMTRGNKYYIGFDVSYTDDNGSNKLYPSNTNVNVPAAYGLFSNDVEVVAKNSPKVRQLNPVMSYTDNSIKFEYEIIDVDNSLYSYDNNAKIYYTIRDGEEQAIAINKTDDSVSHYKGEFTITGLNNGDWYTFSESINIKKSGIYEEDIVDKVIGNANRLFDGYYDAKQADYNFKFEVINNPFLDNKVTIKILATDDILKRILLYRIQFNDQKDQTFNRDIWDLGVCEDDNSIRCIEIQYTDFKKMKSSGNDENIITVHIDGYYDNGLVGIGYADTMRTENGYPYMILQETSTKDSIGKYWILNNNTFKQRNDAMFPYGYYTFSVSGTDDEKIVTYASLFNPSNINIFSLYPGENGYQYADGNSVVPKMMSVETMGGVNNNFSFSGITPMIKINNTVGIINGANIKLNLSGADIDDLCKENNNSSCASGTGGKYLYIAVWDNYESVGNMDDLAIPMEKIELKDSAINGDYETTIYNLPDGSKYYYRVYTYMNNNGEKKLVHLFDGNLKDEALTYEFSSMNLKDIYKSYLVSYRTTDDELDNLHYNDKYLNTLIEVNGYDDAGAIPLNYYVSYAFCEIDSGVCNLDEGNNIFKRDINTTALSMSDTVNITSNNLTFGKNYRLYIYATYDVYDKESGNVIQVTKPFYVDDTSSLVFLSPLQKPYFTFSRNAQYLADLDDTVIDIVVSVHDTSKVLKNGKYSVKISDMDGNLVGNLQISEDGGDTYVTMPSDYEIDANASNLYIRFGGLSKGQLYIVTVYGTAEIKNEGVESAETYVENFHKVYSTNEYGIAFGEDIFYTALADSIQISYPGGSNFKNVLEVIYKVEDYDANTIIASGSYEIGVEGKQFEINKETDEWMFLIDPPGMENVFGHTYIITTSYVVKDGDGTRVLSAIDYPEFSGRIQYKNNNQ